VRTDIDQDDLCPALVNKIENEAVLVRNPEQPESFLNPAQSMGFFGKDETVLLQTEQLFWQIVPSVPGAGATTFCKFS
jgi:hypothetical protein